MARSWEIFPAFVIENKTLDNILLEMLRRPDAESCGDVAFHPVTNGNNHVQIVKIELPLDIPRTLTAN